MPATRTAPTLTAGGPLPSLTGMRWLAAFTVFLYHVKNFGYLGGPPGRFADWAFTPGMTGVSFFFILSGFVLAWSARPGDRPGLFWRRRLARVYPLHLVTALAALALAFSLLPRLRPSGPPEALANLLLVNTWYRPWWQALNPLSWSLTCEAFFYAAFPLIYLALRRPGPRAVAAVAVGAALTVIILPVGYSLAGLGWDTPSSFPPARLPEFVLGVALGRLLQTTVWRGPGLKASMAITLAGYVLTGYVPGEYTFAACTVLGMALLIPAAAAADLNGTPSVWRRPLMVRLGELSFAFYLVHLLLMRVGERLFGGHPQLGFLPGMGVTAMAFTTCLAMAWALHEAVERPGRRWIMPRSR
ncbi:MAG: acyltransferase [Streptosporangiaceae bacterium]